MKTKGDLMSFLAIPNPKGPLSVSHAVLEEPNLGVRKAMEDFTIAIPDLLKDGHFALYAVLDGHGGSDVSKFVKETYPTTLSAKLKSHFAKAKMADILRSSMEELEGKIKMIGGRDSGTTFSGVLLSFKDKMIYYINIGDSNVLAVRFDSKNVLHSDFKCPPHKVSNEKEKQRVIESGGAIMNGRLAGNLLITRSLGDFNMHEYGLIGEPEVFESLLFKNKLLVVASDGVWDVIDEQMMVKLVKTNSKKGLGDLAKVIVKESVDLGSMDNIAVIVVKIGFGDG